MRAEPGRGYERLVELIIGAKIAAALHVVVDKGLADVLARGPQTAEALAQVVQVPVETLRRFLRALTQVGLFAEVKDGVFANTEVSEHLRSDVHYSLRDMVTVLDDEAVARGWRRLPDVLASGQPAFDAVNGMGFFDWIKSDPVRSAAMASFMGGIYGPQGPKIAAGYPFGAFRRSSISGVAMATSWRRSLRSIPSCAVPCLISLRPRTLPGAFWPSTGWLRGARSWPEISLKLFPAASMRTCSILSP